jgi:hypothetical protein
MGKKSGSGSGMNNPYHISESLETIFWVKIGRFFDADPGWKNFGSGMEEIWIQDPTSRFRNTAVYCRTALYLAAASLIMRLHSSSFP